VIENAIAAALRSEWPTYKVGAACFDKRKRLLSVGWNKQKTHTTQAKWAGLVKQPLRQFLHAEMDALIRLRHEPYYIVVVLVTKSGLGMAKPCPICARAIQEAGVKHILYTSNKGTLVEDK